MSNLLIKGIVPTKDKKPYIQVSSGKQIIAKLSVREARDFAHYIISVCSRTEADAMILRFFDKKEFPQTAGIVVMKEFQEFRLDLDFGE